MRAGTDRAMKKTGVMCMFLTRARNSSLWTQALASMFGDRDHGLHGKGIGPITLHVSHHGQHVEGPLANRLGGVLPKSAITLKK